MRRFIAAALLAVTLAGCASWREALFAPREPARAEMALDHMLVWSRDGEAAAATLRDKLGFTLDGERRDPDGVATRVLWFADNSYLQLVFLHDPATAARDAPTEVAFLGLTYGPSNFGLRTSDLDSHAGRQAARGLAMEPMGSRAGDTTQWRGLAPPQGMVPGEPFLTQYLSPPTDKRSSGVADHANHARRLSAVWVAVPDLKAAAAAYARFGLTRTRAVPLPHLNARGLKVMTDGGAILLVQPLGPGPAQDALGWVGHKVFGVSLEVDDLEAAERRLERGYGARPARYRGPFGDSVLAPSWDELRLQIEFHAAR